MRIKVYLDEDVPFSFFEALSNRGIDAVTTQHAGNSRKSDSEQLAYAAEMGRLVF